MLWRRPKTVALDFLESMGNESPDDAIAMLADDVCYTDSRGDVIEGRAECTKALERFFELGMQYDVDIKSLSQVGRNVLVSGDTNSQYPGMSAHCLWRIKTEGRQISEFQTHRKDNPPAMARILLGDSSPVLAAAQAG